MEEYAILNSVAKYAGEYLDGLAGRRVYPDENSLKELKKFPVQLPGADHQCRICLNGYLPHAHCGHIVGHYLQGFLYLVVPGFHPHYTGWSIPDQQEVMLNFECLILNEGACESGRRVAKS